MVKFIHFFYHFDRNVDAAGKTDVLVVSDFRRALPQFMIVSVKNLILLGENDGCSAVRSN